MCCHQGNRQKALYDAMQAIDPSLPSPAEFFHLKGREGDGGVKVSNEEAEKALDAVFLAAISNGLADDDDEDWAAVDADERLDQHINWMKARKGILEEGMTSGMVAALGKYVSDLRAASEATKEAEIKQAVKERSKKVSVRTKAAIAGLSLLTLASMTGSALGPSSAENVPTATAVQQQDLAGRALVGQSFKVGGKSVFIGPVKGMCPAGTVMVQNPKTQTLNWKKTPAGKVVKRVVAKGAAVCKFTTASGQTAVATLNAAGQIVALPANFPSKPTAADIASLGLTKDTPVASTLRIPQPSGSANAPAALAQKVRPVGTVGDVYEVRRPAVTDALTGKVITKETVSKFVDVEWQFTGGSGVVALPGRPDSNGNVTQRYVKLDPNGTTRVVAHMPLTADDGGKIAPFFFGSIQPDYGQANLPASVIQNWKLPAAKDKSGTGMPVGVAANPGFWDTAAGPRDGFVNLTPDGRMIGTYNY